MSAEIIPFKKVVEITEVVNEGNGAREALLSMGSNAETIDWFLAKLWSRGYKVVPVDDDDDLIA